MTLISKKNVSIDQLPFESAFTYVMLILLLTFNDPWYFFHIKNPSFATYFIGEVGTAMFVAGILVFWLVDIARHKEPEISPDATKL